MRFWMRPRSTVRYALWLGGLLVLLGGLFGMHGLDNHGGAGMDTIDHATMATPAEHTAAAGHQAIAGTAVTAAKPSAVTLVVTGASGHAGMGMGAAGMCVAVLVLALIALLVRLHAGGVRPLLCLAARPARAPGRRGRDPDPPSLICLSVQRC